MRMDSTTKYKTTLRAFLLFLMLFSGLVIADASEDKPFYGGIQNSIATSSTNKICPVTPKELSDISDILTSATVELLTNRIFSSKKMDFESACTLKLSIVSSLANYLISAYKLVKADVNLFVDLKKNLMVQLSDFNRLVEGIKFSHQQPVSNSPDNFNINLAALQQQINSIFYHANEIQQQNGESSINLCVMHLKNGKAQAAFQAFNRIVNDQHSALHGIIRKAYNHKRNPDNVEQILEFANLLPNCQLASILYSALFDAMEKYGHLNEPDVLTLYEGAKSCRGASHKLQGQLVPHVNNVIIKWIDRIQNNATGEINTFVEKGSLSQNALVSHISDLVSNGFLSNMNNFVSVLNFAAGLPDAALSATAFASLLSEMRKVDRLYSVEILRLAYRLKETMSLAGFSFENNVFEFLKVKNSLPSTVVNLIWKANNCTVKNFRNPEYLYSENVFLGGKRRAFTWGQAGMPGAAFWKFETADEGQTFTIINNHFNEYLYTGGRKDSKSHWVLLSKEMPGDNKEHWKIKPLDNYKFSFLNVFLQECPHAWGMPREIVARRDVTTWVDGKATTADTQDYCQWVLTC